jgi:lipopolysaccharide biosynthesis glycosyltransferase
VKLDVVWNFQPACVVHDDRARALFHFLGGRKPWVARHNRHPMRFVRRYQELLVDSPWADRTNAPALPFQMKECLRLSSHALSARYWRNRALYRSTIARYQIETRG